MKKSNLSQKTTSNKNVYSKSKSSQKIYSTVVMVIKNGGKKQTNKKWGEGGSEP